MVGLVAVRAVKVYVKGLIASSQTDSLKKLLDNLLNVPSGACLRHCVSVDASSN